MGHGAECAVLHAGEAEGVAVHVGVVADNIRLDSGDDDVRDGDRVVVHGGEVDGYGGWRGVQQTVARFEGKGVGAVVVLRGGVGDVWQCAGERAVRGRGDDGVGEGVAGVHVGAGEDDGFGDVFGGFYALRRGDGGLVHGECGYVAGDWGGAVGDDDVVAARVARVEGGK